jgi:hypothetical protein
MVLLEFLNPTYGQVITMVDDLWTDYDLNFMVMTEMFSCFSSYVFLILIMN